MRATGAGNLQILTSPQSITVAFARMSSSWDLFAASDYIATELCRLPFAVLSPSAPIHADVRDKSGEIEAGCQGPVEGCVGK